MLDQLNSTIQWDTGTDFYEEKLKSATEALNNPIDAKKYRKNIIALYTDRIKRLNQEYKKELKQCDVTNKWVSTLLTILDKSH
jgi:ribosomal protein L29